MRNLLALGLIFFSAISLHAHPLTMRPSQIWELGMLHVQRGVVLPGEVAWADYDLMRKDFPFLARATDSEIDQVILYNFSVVSDLQYELENILITPIPDGRRSTLLFHPLTYQRAALATFASKGYPFGVYAVDIKGTGTGPEGEARMRGVLGMLNVLKGEHDSLFQFDEEVLARYRKSIEALEKHIADDEKRLKTAKNADEERRIYHDIEVTHSRLGRLSIFIAGYDAIKADPTQRSLWVERFVEHLRTMDYTNGVASLERLIKEVTVQRALQKLYDEHNPANGTSFDTIRSYFLIALPYEILGPNGQTTRAGIIGRQPHWRDIEGRGSNLRQNYSAALPRNIVGSVLDTADQFDVFGSMVDFELPEVVDRRVSEYLAWDNERGQKVEGEATKAVAAFSRPVRPDKKAISKLITKVLKPLDGIAAPEPPPVSATDRLADLWKLANDPNARASQLLVRFRALQARGTDICQISALLTAASDLHPVAVADFLIEHLDAQPLENFDGRIAESVLFSMFISNDKMSKEAARVVAHLNETSPSKAVSLTQCLIERLIRLQATAGGISLAGFHSGSPPVQAMIQFTSMLGYANYKKTEGTHLGLHITVKLPDGTSQEIDVIEMVTDYFRVLPPGPGRSAVIRAILDTVETLSARELQPFATNSLAELLALEKEGAKDCSEHVASEGGGSPAPPK